jgi:hypothetical protein
MSKDMTSKFTTQWLSAPDAEEVVGLVTLSRWNRNSDITAPADFKRVFLVKVSNGKFGLSGADEVMGGNGLVPKLTRRERLVLDALAHGYYDGGHSKLGSFIWLPI